VEPWAVWSEALLVWDGMPSEERETYRGQLAQRIQVNVQAFFEEASAFGFQNSFALMDLLFFGLALSTAFRIAARGSARGTEPDARVDTA
jgi:hypothetical protein